MAFNDALFQLGMDLTRSSTAQKEDPGFSAPTSQEDCLAASARSAGSAHTSKHLIVDLTGAKRCETAKGAEKALQQALEAAHIRVAHAEVRRCGKGRCLSGSASTDGGEVKIEVWPETGYVAVDIFGSAASFRPELLMTLLMDAFGAREAMIKKSRSAAEVARLTKPVRWLQPAPAAGRTARAMPERLIKSKRAA
jgi:S-adenosylmethionine decarboxylase